MTIAKFEIENTFSTGKEGYDPEREERERLIALAREQGREAGFKEGHAQALTEIEARTADAMAQLQAGVANLFNERAALEQTLEADAARMAFVIANKLAKSLLADQPTAEIETLIVECLTAGVEETVIRITVHPDLVDPLTAKLDQIKMNTGFTGEIKFHPNPEFSPQDLIVEWPNGGLRRSYDGLEEQITSKISTYLGQPIETELPKSPEQPPEQAPEQMADQLAGQADLDQNTVAEDPALQAQDSLEGAETSDTAEIEINDPAEDTSEPDSKE